ncbi:MAG: hypothetical protein LBI79_05495 [Nitrososphaerota archaeon]|nr:hypothetical protein [Nitrososphaerota archaeon]
MVKVKSKITGRFSYIAFGTVFLGLFLFLLIMKFRGESYFVMFPLGSTGDNIMGLLSFVVCCVIGGVIGEFIGKKMKYRWPPFSP